MYLAEGFDAFLSKPVNPDKLEQMILRLLPRELLEFDVEEDEVTGRSVSGEMEGSCRLGTESIRPSLEENELPVIDGIDWAYGFMHLPDKELLLDTVKDFYKTIEAEANALEQFYQESKADAKMLDQYRIKVHSMKSSANLIGAVVLGGMAKVLENAARDGEVERMDALHGIFLNDWRVCRKKLEGLVGMDKKAKASEAEDMADNVDRIQDCLNKLKAALEEMDIDLMDRLMEELEGFSYPAHIQAKLELLGVQITNLAVEQAEEIIETLIKEVKI